MISFLSSAFALKYKYFLKPVLFLFDAEAVHHTFTNVGSQLGRVSFVRAYFRWMFVDQNIKPVTIDGITFPSRVGLAAGFDYNADLAQILPNLGFGFHTMGTITWKPYPGNPKPRLGRFPKSKALLVNKGLKTIGTQAVIKKLKTTSRGNLTVPAGISIASSNTNFKDVSEQLQDILLSFIAFEKSGLKHAYYEMNVSCPNTFGGEPFTKTPEKLDLLLTCLDELKLSRPVYVKMPIDQTEKYTLQLLEVIDKHDIAGVIFGNLAKNRDNPDMDPEEAEQWRKMRGNLSGKPTWKKSNALIKLTRKNYPTRFTIIGTGGIFSPEDAETKIKLGADLVQLIAGMIYTGPQVVGRIGSHLDKISFATEKQ